MASDIVAAASAALAALLAAARDEAVAAARAAADGGLRPLLVVDGAGEARAGVVNTDVCRV